MKTTDFQFDLRLGEADRERQFEKLKETILGVKGVLKVDCRASNSGCNCHIQVEFPDSEAAKKLHRKLMNLLMRTPDVEISSVTTKLTEIFD
ncbi:hypothetical protein [Lignipirellula cremea]|uniref:Uncharacterized protein n=1 Tax=Lignipirellula cremea TaxID=2528010 RepID=A0A518DY87_9BACT|nr:hypothetical protein [Lignipirellula cremea]QDU96813.1 hypothetical protein Pla8534_46350 [Lignipirellula cremea]